MASKKRSLAESTSEPTVVVNASAPPPPPPPPPIAVAPAPPKTDEEPPLKKLRPDEPVAPAQQVIRSAHIIYPDQYGSFDPKRIAFAPTAQPAREGGGQILFMSYVHSDGQTRPLLIHTPRGMHAPMGVKLWKDGKSSALLSLGRDLAGDPLMSQFRTICDSVQQRCAEIAVEKNWMGSRDLEATKNQFSPLVFVGSSDKGEPYPPSLKATVIVSGKDKSEFFEYSTTPPLKSLIPGDLEGTCTMTAVLHLAWVFAKKAKKGTEFSIRCNLFQGIVEGNAGSSASRNGCAVLL
jgi:hypothetical protein